MTLLIQYMLMFASVLLLVALGGCFSEHSGVINIGLEGIMVFGALGGALMMKYLPGGHGGAWSWCCPSIADGQCSSAFCISLLLAVAAINFKRGSDAGRHGHEPAGHRQPRRSSSRL